MALIAKLLADPTHTFGTSTGFFVSWITSGYSAFALQLLDDDERGLVAGYISALFGIEGISDDLLHGTDPRALLRLAPTIMEQALLAFRAGVIDETQLRSGLSFWGEREMLGFSMPAVTTWLVQYMLRWCVGGSARALTS